MIRGLLVLALALPALAQEVTVLTRAGFTPGPVAAGSIASAFGAGFSFTTIAAPRNPPPRELGGVTLAVRDSAGAERNCRLFLVSPEEITFAVHSLSRPGPAVVTVRRDGQIVGQGTFEIVEVAPGLFEAPKKMVTAAIVRVDPQGGQTIEEVIAPDGEGGFEPVPISFGPETDRLVLVLFGTGLRNGEVRQLRVGSAHLDSNDVGTFYDGRAPSFFALDQINSGFLPRRLEDFGGGLKDIRAFVAAPPTAISQEVLLRTNIVHIVFAPNPDAPVLTSFALSGRPVEGNGTELDIGFDFTDRDGDLGLSRLHLLLTGDAGFCLSRIEDPGSPGQTAGQRQFTITATEGQPLGAIRGAELSVRDQAGRNSNFIAADPLNAQGEWRVPCAFFIPRGAAPAASTDQTPEEVKTAMKEFLRREP